MQCVTSSQLSANGEILQILVLSPESPDQCQGYLLLTRSEVADFQEPFFLPLTMSDGLAISLAIGSLWALAFLFKFLTRFLSPHSNGD